MNGGSNEWSDVVWMVTILFNITTFRMLSYNLFFLAAHLFNNEKKTHLQEEIFVFYATIINIFFA